MRHTSLAFAVTSLFALLSLAGCEKSARQITFPDASFDFDLGTVDGGAPDLFTFPDATVDTCTAAGRGATIGMPCDRVGGCDDGCYCNGIERCEAGVCAAGAEPCTDTIECTESACLEETDTCFQMPQNARCSDGDACNGLEVCDPDPLVGGCRPSAPLYCNDESSCTVDECDTAMGCTYTVRDLDGDGYTDGRCGGEDCDDDPRFGTLIYPGASENCTNRRDDDCDGQRDYNDASCTPMNDTCGPTAVALPGAGTYSGSTRGLRSDYTLSCTGGSSDAVFTFSLTEPRDVRATAASPSGGAIAIRALATCGAGPDLKCNGGSSPSTLIRSLPAGDYAIIVKTNSPEPFDLNLRITPPTETPAVDQCTPATFDVSAGGTFSGSFEEVEDDSVLPCNGSGSSKDAAYRFTITSPKDVTITASTLGMWSPTTYLNLTTDCASAAASLSCIADSSPRLRRRALPAGTYYVQVESADMSSAGWTITVSLTDPLPPAAGDTCVSPVDITTAPGRVGAAGLDLDGSASCLTFTSGYRDAYFMFDVATTSDVEVTTSTTSFSDVVALQTSCGSSGTELRCRSTGGTGTQLFRSLAPGRYYVLVATQATTGNINASVRLLPPTPVPANDSCAGAVELVAPFTRMSGTLVDFEDDAPGGSCGGGGAADAFYRITLTEPQRVSVIATRVGGSGSMELVLRRAGCSGAEVRCATGDPTAAIDELLTAGSYFLQIEQSTWGGTSSDFTVSAFFSPP